MAALRAAVVLAGAAAAAHAMLSPEATPSWMDAYQKDGFVPELGSLPDGVAERLRDTATRMEAQGVDFSQQVVNAHIQDYPELMEVAADPGVLRAVEAVVGPEVLLVSTTFFMKYPKVNSSATSPACLTVVGAHQDRQYWSILPSSAPVVSVWVAVSDVDRANGAMKFYAGTHHGQLHHERGADNCSALMSGQAIPKTLLPEKAVDIELRSGRYALFHSMLAHESGRNTSPRKRLGFTMIYASAHVEYKDLDYPPDQLYAGDWRVPSVLVKGSPEAVKVPLAVPGHQSYTAPGSGAEL